MSTAFETHLQVAPNLPVARAWRIGSGLVVAKCPLCRGIHRHGEPVGDDDPTRVNHCESVFSDGDPGAEYILDVQREALPHQIALAIARDLPLSNLANAYTLISDGRSVSEWKFRHHDPDDDDEQFWVPAAEHIRFAFDALRRCGGLDEAAALRAELAGLAGRELWRAAASDVWRRRPGRSWRNRLLHALMQCYRQNGGPV